MEIFEKVKTIVKEFLSQDSSGHDVSHAERVFNIAMTIHEKEGGDKEIIGIASLVHDICRPWEKQTGKSHFGDEALEIIRNELLKIKTEESVITKVLDIVAEHDLYDWTIKNDNKSIELKIVQDADNLDAIGAIGIGRTFAFGGSHGRAMYSPGEDLNVTEDYIDTIHNNTTTIKHFYEKLFKLSENMNTEAGKSMAHERHNFMVKFVDQFIAEWNGEK